MDTMEIEAIAALGAWYERYKPYERSMPSVQRVFLLLDEIGCGRLLLQQEQYAVYALVDPRNEDIRYIGVTSHPERRRIEHNKDETNLRKQDWLAELKTTRQRPVMRVLEVVSGLEEARVREARWIDACVHAGLDLVNIASASSSRVLALAAEEKGRLEKRRLTQEQERALILEYHSQGMPAYVICRQLRKSAAYAPEVKRIIAEVFPQKTERERVLEASRANPNLKPYQICTVIGISTSKWQWVEQVLVEAEEEQSA